MSNEITLFWNISGCTTVQAPSFAAENKRIGRGERQEGTVYYCSLTTYHLYFIANLTFLNWGLVEGKLK